MFLLHFLITDSSPDPGARHSSIQEAMKASGDSGTGSILDMCKVSTIPFEEAMTENGMGASHFCVATTLRRVWFPTSWVQKEHRL